MAGAAWPPNGRVVGSILGSAAGLALFILECMILFGAAENVSSGGPSYFPAEAMFTGVPSFEIGIMATACVIVLFSERSWRSLSRLNKVVWTIVVANFALLISHFI